MTMKFEPIEDEHFTHSEVGKVFHISTSPVQSSTVQSSHCVIPSVR